MDHEKKMRAAEEFFNRCRLIQATKGKDYMLDADVWSDLKKESQEYGVTPELLLLIMLTKHYKAIRRYCVHGKVESEPIEGRLMDLANYACMMYAFGISKNEEESK